MRTYKIPADICYGSMSFFITIVHNIFLLYHVEIFVSVYRIDKTSFWIGETIFLIWNSCNDPLFGWMSDSKYLNTSAQKGNDVVLQRLSFLQRFGPLFALSFLGFWISWTFPWLQFVVCLCLYDGFLTLIDLHHSALLADLAVSAEIRTRLNSKCSVFAAIGSATVFLSYAIWDKENLNSFRIYCAVVAFVSFLGFFFVSSLLKSYYTSSKESQNSTSDFHHGFPGVIGNTVSYKEMDLDDEMKPDHQTFKSYVYQLLQHKNFLLFSVMNLIQVFHCHFNSNFFPLFLENLLGETISPMYGSILIGLSFVAPHVNNLYFLTLCRKYGVYNVIYVLFGVKLLLSLLMFFAGPSYIWLLCIFIASNRVFTEGTCKLLNLVISDLVDEDYVKNHRHQAVSALIFGTAALLSKPGQTLAPLIGTWMLASTTGHDVFETAGDVGSIKFDVKNLDVASRESYKQGCFNLLVYIPIICAVCQLAVWTQFSLHGRRLQYIKSRREGSEKTFV
ncbi:hypothetical protein SNE40_012876 [Patella caerulea]|uniref:Transmembrane protein 180 n=1 Tax=Patella caerulea TaxID=87958 RepID=A0AAN8JIK4_PATCE